MILLFTLILNAHFHSRDKSQIDELMTENIIERIVHHAGMNPDNLRSDLGEDGSALVAAGQGCMNNLLLQSAKARTLFASDSLGVIPGIMALVTGWRELSIPPTMLLTDLKLLFLLTALDKTHRTKKQLLVEHDALDGLGGLLDDVLTKANDSSVAIGLSDELVDLAGEVLKVLFNSTLVLTDETSEEANLMKVCRAVNKLLLVKTSSAAKRDALTS